MSVNVSPLQLLDAGFEDAMVSALAVSGLAPERLEIEVTETALIGRDSHAPDVLQRLSGKGIRIALDDFGTGFSSLSLLQQAPFTTLKVDRCFVKDLPGSMKSLNIIRSVISLCRGLDLQVTIEGVETEAQLRTVTDEGCDNVQGYIFSKPQPKELIEEFFPDRKPVEA